MVGGVHHNMFVVLCLDPFQAQNFCKSVDFKTLASSKLPILELEGISRLRVQEVGRLSTAVFDLDIAKM